MNVRHCQCIIFCALLVSLTATSVSAQSFDISSGGAPTISGSSGGSVTGSSSVTSNLSVTVDFGEVSPLNTNNFVKVVIPVAIRSTAAYQVAISTTSSTFGASAQAVKSSDIGIGILSPLRSLGANAQVCTASPHSFYSPFNNDPTLTSTINASGRTTYPSTLASIGASSVILSGPRLTKSGSFGRFSDNGYVFDFVLAIKPQFYATGTFSVTLHFTISGGPSAPC